MQLEFPQRGSWPLDRPRLVGIVNATPDSFSDGGRYDAPKQALSHARAMVEAGADAIDVGGESTRPGAARVSIDQQTDRVVPVIKALSRELNVPISIDTTRRAVAEAALDAGACWINDVSAGLDDQGMLALAASRGVPIVLMHKRGEPESMQREPHYEDVVSEVRAFLMERAQAAESAGVSRSQIVIDPGIGFGKTTAHNLALMAGLRALVDTGYPVLLGASRKRFLGEITGESEPARRAAATAATTAMGVAAGVTLFRMHDVAANRHAADVTAAVLSHQRS